MEQAKLDALHFRIRELLESQRPDKVTRNAAAAMELYKDSEVAHFSNLYYASVSKLGFSKASIEALIALVMLLGFEAGATFEQEKILGEMIRAGISHAEV